MAGGRRPGVNEKNWNAEVKKYASKGQLKQWEDVFKLDLIGMKALDYLTCFSITSCLIKVDAGRFDKVVLATHAHKGVRRVVLDIGNEIKTRITTLQTS